MATEVFSFFLPLTLFYFISSSYNENKIHRTRGKKEVVQNESKLNKILFSLSLSSQEYLVSSSGADHSTFRGPEKAEHIIGANVRIFIFYELTVWVPSRKRKEKRNFHKFLNFTPASLTSLLDKGKVVK